MSTLDRRSGPLYRRVADDIIEQVQGGRLKPGERLPSERALCDLYQVSQITVRRALRELRHEGVVLSRHGLGWFVGERTDLPARLDEVVLVTPHVDWLTAALLGHLGAALESSHMMLRVAITEGAASAEAQALHTTGACAARAALIVLAGPSRDLGARYAARLEGLEIPCVLLLREVDGLQASAIVLDERECMAQVTRYVLDLGHTRVGYIGLDPVTIEGHQRYWGFAGAVWDSGLELPLDWSFTPPLSTGSARDRFRQVFASRSRPTALVCADDLMAVEAMGLLEASGLRCPADVAIASLGDRDFAALLPTPLTTFRPDLPGLAAAAAQSVKDLLAGRAASSVRLTGRLITRKSCGPAVPAPR